MRRSPSSSGPWSTLERADFAARVAGLAAKRLAGWALQPERYPEPTRVGADAAPHLVAQLVIPRRASSFGPKLERGRWHNLGLAATALDGVGISAASPFSFWRTVGRLSAGRGFVEGAHFEGGCIVPAVGGGVCSLSDALFDLALRSGCTILERHGHTLAVDRGPKGPRRKRVDATVKWPYVDLRFAPARGLLRLSTRSRKDGLHLALHGDAPVEAWPVEVSEPQICVEAGQRYVHTTIRRGPTTIGRDRKKLIVMPTRNCDTCQEHSCGRHRGA
ncbi:VanW family protein [Plesiocystis pacifica]|uniref:VanW family protein n=1 Tax=Plesiocystis pacifica TaxID=191768 RepID=UPI0012FCAFDB|nr:VanW family protein [Plesiocystis pacifica]